MKGANHVLEKYSERPPLEWEDSKRSVVRHCCLPHKDPRGECTGRGFMDGGKTVECAVFGLNHEG